MCSISDRIQNMIPAVMIFEHVASVRRTCLEAKTKTKEASAVFLLHRFK